MNKPAAPRAARVSVLGSGVTIVRLSKTQAVAGAAALSTTSVIPLPVTLSKTYEPGALVAVSIATSWLGELYACISKVTLAPSPP